MKQAITAEKEPNKSVISLIAAMSSFLTPFTSSSVNIALPSIGRELSLSALSLGWIATAYLLAAFINYGATFAVVFLLSLYFQRIRGFTAEHAGMILIVQPLMQIVFSPIAGALSDRIEPRLLATAGMAATTAGLVMLSFLQADTSLAWIIACLAIMGIGFGFFSSPNTNAIMSSVEKKFYGSASGMVGTMRLTGQMFSMGIIMLLFSLYLGKVRITPEYHDLFMQCARTGFVVFAALCFTGIFSSLSRGNMH